MEYVKLLTLDINKEYVGNIRVMQKDSARALLFKLKDNGKAFSLTGKTVKAYTIKPDGSKVSADLTVTDSTNGSCKLKLTSAMLSLGGSFKLMLSITDGTDTFSTIPFSIQIIKSLN